MKWNTGISCIYKITNIKNGKTYIGQTKSIANRHKYAKNYINCTKLWEDIQKDGWYSFTREIVEMVPIDKLNEKELEWIKKENPEYNTRFGEDHVNQLSQEMKDKISATKKSDASIPRTKVQCVETGEIFDSITDAARHVGATKISISRAIRGIYKSSKGYTWKEVSA